MSVDEIFSYFFAKWDSHRALSLDIILFVSFAIHSLFISSTWPQIFSFACDDDIISGL